MDTTERRVRLVGVAFAVAAVILNEWVLTGILSPDGRIESPALRYAIRVFQLLMLLLGAVLIRYRRVVPLDALRSAARAHPVLLGLAVSALLILLLIGTAETLLFFANRFKARGPVRERERLSGFLIPDEALGDKPRASTKAAAVHRTDGRIDYEVTYSTDQFGRRLTPMTCRDRRNEFFVLFGGSIAFGWGLEDDETLPSYVAQLAPDYEPYNYGVSGYGTAHMLAKLQSGALKKELSQSSGKMVYLFIDHHVNRVIGSLDVYLWNRPMPHYELDGRGQVVRVGNYPGSRPLYSLFLSIMSRSQIVGWRQINIPSRLRDSDLLLTAKIIQEADRVVQTEFPGTDFYLCFFPGWRLYPRLEPLVRRAGVKVLDYSTLFDMDSPEFNLKGLSHPTAKANRLLAETLAKDLGIEAPAKQSGRAVKARLEQSQPQ